MMHASRLITLAGVLLVSTPFAQATTADDAYIAGYAAAALKHELKLDMPALTISYHNRQADRPARFSGSEMAKEKIGGAKK